MTKISGLPWRSAMSTVAPTARRSCGLGRVGTSTRSAWATTWEMDWVMAGGVSITAMRMPMRSSPASASSRSSSPALTKCGAGAWRAFHQCASEPCGSVSISATSPAPAHRLDRQMAGQGGLSGSALLGGCNDGVHGISPDSDSISITGRLFRPREGGVRNLSLIRPVFQPAAPGKAAETALDGGRPNRINARPPVQRSA